MTLDADLQNPPEEIPRLVAEMRAGHDYVGTIRRQRNDSTFRRVASRLMNRFRERITNIHMTDQGCMLRAYDRALVDTLNACREVNTFIPALAYTFAVSPVEIEVEHEARHAGESKYSLYKLLRLNFDLVTGFSIVPLQWFSLIGMLLSLCSGALFVLLLVRRFLLRRGSGGRVHAVRAAVLPDRHRALRRRPDGRVRRPHPAGGATAATATGSAPCSRRRPRV